MRMFKSILRGSSSILFFKVISAGCSFLSNIMISRIYGPEIYGEYSLFFSIISIMLIFNMLGLDIYVIKIVNELNDVVRIKGFLKKSLNILLSLGISITLLFFLLSTYISSSYFNGQNYLPVILIGVFISFFALIRYIGAIFRAHGNIIYFAIIDGLVIQLPIFTAFVLLYYLGFNGIHPVWILYFGILIGFISSLALCLKFLRKKYGGFREIPSYNSKIIQFSYPMMLTSSIIYLMGYLDTLIISNLMDNYHVGLYSAIVKLSLPLTFVSASLSGFLAPKIAQYYSKNQLGQVRKLYRSSIFFLFSTGLCILLVYFFYGKEILGVYGKEYVGQIKPFYIYLCSSFLSGALFGPIGYFLVLTDHQKQFLVILAISLVLNLVLNLILIPLMGISGAAVAILVATVFWKLTGYIILNRKKIL